MPTVPTTNKSASENIIKNSFISSLIISEYFINANWGQSGLPFYSYGKRTTDTPHRLGCLIGAKLLSDFLVVF